MEHAECSDLTNGTCQCEADYYSQAGQCQERVPVPQPCKHSRQCVANALCSPDKGVCLCDTGFYNENGECAGSECMPLVCPCGSVCPCVCVSLWVCGSVGLCDSRSSTTRTGSAPEVSARVWCVPVGLCVCGSLRLQIFYNENGECAGSEPACVCVCVSMRLSASVFL